MAAQSTSPPDGVVLRWRGPLSDAEMADLVASYGGTPVPGWWDRIRPHSFGWVTARAADDVVVGFVNIVTAQVRVAVCGLHFNDAFTDFQNGNIKCSAAEVEHSYRFFFLFVQTVSERGGCRFVNNTHYFETGNFTGIFRRLTLRIIKICRNGNYGFIHFRS